MLGLIKRSEETHDGEDSHTVIYIYVEVVFKVEQAVTKWIHYIQDAKPSSSIFTIRAIYIYTRVTFFFSKKQMAMSRAKILMCCV